MIELQNVFYPDFEMRSWKKGTIFIIKGRISFRNKSQKHKIINLEGKYCVPSFIESHSHIGICRKGEYNTKNALVDSLPFNINKKSDYNFSFKDKAFKDIRNQGIKFISVDPGSTSYISGNCFFVDLTKRKDSIRPTNTLKMAVGSVPFEYQSKKLNLKKESDCFNKLEEFLLNNKIKLKNKTIKIHAYKKADVLKIIELKEKYGFKLIILHGNGLIKLGKKEIEKIDGIIIGPITHTYLREEGKSDLIETALYLYRKNINFSITTDHPVTPLQFLRLNVIILKNKGVDDLTCIRLITKNAADNLGLIGFGEIKESFKANLLIFNDNPLKIESHIIYEINNGEIRKCH